jgi:hypothetical protein
MHPLQTKAPKNSGSCLVDKFHLPTSVVGLLQNVGNIKSPNQNLSFSLSLSLSLSLPPTTRNPNFHSEVRSQNPKKEILIVILRKQKTPEKLQKTKRDAFSSRKNRVIFSFLFFSSVQIATALKV